MSTATGPETEVDPAIEGAPEVTKKAKVKPEVKVDPGLQAIIAKFDEATETAVSYQIEMIDYIKKNNISRGVLIKTLVECRKIEVTSANSEASRILALAKDEETFNDLKEGKITLRAARQATKKTREPKAPSQDDKEKAYESSLQAFAKACKALGLPVKDILTSVKSTLTAEPYSMK